MVVSLHFHWYHDMSIQLLPFKLDAAVEPQDIFHALQQQINERLGNIDNRLQNIDNHVKIGLAQPANVRIVSRNTRLQAPLQLTPVSCST